MFIAKLILWEILKSNNLKQGWSKYIDKEYKQLILKFFLCQREGMDLSLTTMEHTLTDLFQRKKRQVLNKVYSIRKTTA